MGTEKIKLMIVDDHPVISDGLKILLSDVKNIDVAATASNGKEALTVLKTKAVDVILLDIDMPVMNGIDAAPLILSAHPKIKIIALTSYSEKTLIKKMSDAGASGYLLKNVKKEEIVTAIQNVFKGEKYFGGEVAIHLAKNDAAEMLSNTVQHELTKLLSEREMEVLQLIANGFSNNAIAEKLFVSPKTVDNHRTTIMRKLNVHNVAGLVRIAIQNKLAE